MDSSKCGDRTSPFNKFRGRGRYNEMITNLPFIGTVKVRLMMHLYKLTTDIS
jgi:hypothetical protein